MWLYEHLYVYAYTWYYMVCMHIFSHLEYQCPQPWVGSPLRAPRLTDATSWLAACAEHFGWIGATGENPKTFNR